MSVAAVFIVIKLVILVARLFQSPPAPAPRQSAGTGCLGVVLVLLALALMWALVHFHLFVPVVVVVAMWLLRGYLFAPILRALPFPRLVYRAGRVLARRPFRGAATEHVLLAAEALLRKPSQSGQDFLEQRIRNGRHSDFNVAAAAGLLATSLGDWERATALMTAVWCGHTERPTRPFRVAQRWLVCAAARRGDWGGVIRVAGR